MEVIDIGLSELEPVSFQLHDHEQSKTVESAPSVNFGPGIELLMNDNERSGSRSTNIDVKDLDALESELNELSNKPSETPSNSGGGFSDIFKLYGEDAFRDVESRVICRLLNSKVQIIATGGGAFINANIRRIITEKGISLWLRAELGILIERTGRRGGRPLLEGNDAEEILKKLMDERYPKYAEANIIVDSRDVPIQETVNETIAALSTYIENQTGT